MPTADDIKDAIAENATGPREALTSESATSVKQHPLPDQIAAHKHIAGNDAVAGTVFPIRRCKVAPPGGRDF